MNINQKKIADVEIALETLSEKTDGLVDHIHDLEHFHKIVMERVFGMLSNAESFGLHSLVKNHLEEIQKLGNIESECK